jgi:hypothetical protein
MQQKETFTGQENGETSGQNGAVSSFILVKRVKQKPIYDNQLSGSG